MAFRNSVTPIALSSINSATFTGSYQLLSAAAGLPAACIMLHIANNSTVPITVSYNGTTDHDFILSAHDRELNFQTNGQPQNFAASLPKGTKIYVKGTGPGTGSIYLAGYYQN